MDYAKIEQEQKAIKDELSNLIERTKKLAFTHPWDAKDEDAMGIMISQYFEWDQTSIIKTALHSFKDANFHKLVEDFSKITGVQI